MMSQSTFVYVSSTEDLSLQDITNYFTYYQEITAKTGEQLDWEYDGHAFPYEVEEKKDENGHYLLLKGKLNRYHAILVGVSQNDEEKYVQLTLPDSATHGDKGKANEFAKFLGKKLKGKIKLFNGRMMA
jgi:hypothetical protein